MSDSILEIRNISKRYGDVTAVDNLSFDVPRGSVFGLLGPNGAGKSTTIRMIMRIIMADEGAIRLDGVPVDDDRRRLIGYLPEERGLYKKMKVLEHLVFLGTLRGLKPGDAKRRALGWLERYKLRWDLLIMREFGDYQASRAFKQRTVGELRGNLPKIDLALSIR